MKTNHNYTIKAVAQRTGLSPHVIRIWERRYEAVTPERSETNRRLYSEADVKRLKLLHDATQHGHSIGTIAQLPDDELATLIPEETEEQKPSSGAQFSNDNPPYFYLDACIGAIQRLDGIGLENLLTGAARSLPLPVFIQDVVLPLMSKIGEFWEDGTLKIANEHLASSVIKTVLNNLRTKHSVSKGDHRLLATTPQGQLHEIGSLIITVIAAFDGWHTSYFGPDLPIDEILTVAQKNDADVVCLSMIYPERDSQISKEMLKLKELQKQRRILIAGGQAVHSYETVLEKIGAEIITDIEQFRERLEAIKE